jgi:hypothetical protein
MVTSEARLRRILRMLKRPRRQVLGLGSLVLLASVAIVLSGGSLSAVAVLIGLSLPPAFVIPVIWRIMTGRELLSDIEDFQQERLVPLMKELESRGIEATLLELPSDGKGEFAPLAPFKTFENLAQMRLSSHEVDFVHIGYWTDSKSGTEAFYLDFAVECEIEDESRISTELSMMKRLVLFGRRQFKWWGEGLAQSLDQDVALRENLPDVCEIMELPALWVVPDAEERVVRIHIPYVKRVDPKQFPAILAIAGQIAHHIKSLAQSWLSVEEE